MTKIMLLLQTCIKGFPSLRKLRFGQRLDSWFVVRIVGVGPYYIPKL